MLILGLPLIGPMFVPILSALLLLLVTGQLVYAGKQLRASSTTKQPSVPESAPANVDVDHSSSSESENSEQRLKKKKKSCCGSKGACCQTKKADGMEETSAGAKKCGCSCGSKKESSAEGSDSDNHSEVLDVEDLALLLDSDIAVPPKGRMGCQLAVCVSGQGPASSRAARPQTDSLNYCFLMR